MTIFSGWRDFYQVTGEAAATLTGLLFVVVTLTAGRQSPAGNQGARLFTSPTVFHLASVLVISALALAPDGEMALSGAIMTGWSGAGLIFAVGVAVRILRLEARSHWTDFWWYGFAPSLTYAVLAAANACALARLTHAAYAVALGLLLALVVAIRNAWDLATWLAIRRD